MIDGSLSASLEKLVVLDNYYRWVFEEIRPFLGSDLAEIGAGTGTFTKFLLDAHVLTNPAARMTVFEPSVDLYRKLQDMLQDRYAQLLRNGRLSAVQGYFQTSREGFDTILMINVLEHIENDREAVRDAHQSLLPDGTFVVFVPALPWLYSQFDHDIGHFRRYDKRPLEDLLRTNGFTVVKTRYMDCLGVLPWYLLNVLGGSRSLNPHLVRLYDAWFVPVTKWIERLRAPGFGKNIVIVGRKAGACR